MNYLKSIIYKSKITLDKEQHEKILYEIELVNITRVKMLLTILFVVELVFIFTNDIHYLINPAADIMWKGYGYFIVHLLMLLTCVTGLFFARRLSDANTGRSRTALYNYFTPVVLVFFLILTSLLDGLDRLNFKNINSLFIANLLICGGAFILNFPKNLFTYTIPFSGYIVIFFLVNSQRNIIVTHLINDLIFLFAVIVISTSMYNYQYEVIAEKIVLERTNRLLVYVSNHDSLTGLINRRCFMDQLKIKRESKVNTASLVIVDIDFFKNINDFYGHPVGDMVLKMVSSVLMKHMKAGDLVARWGGEEFLLFLDNTSSEKAYTVTDAIRKDIEELKFQDKDYSFKVTASFGIAAFINKDEESFYTAYKSADSALYHAKDQGRNRVVKGGANGID